MATNSQTAWWIKEYIKKNSHEKNKMEKKKYTPRKLKRKRDNPKRKNPQIYSIKLKIVCFSP